MIAPNLIFINLQKVRSVKKLPVRNKVKEINSTKSAISKTSKSSNNKAKNKAKIRRRDDDPIGT
jgi:hypothetical protein